MLIRHRLHAFVPQGTVSRTALVAALLAAGPQVAAAQDDLATLKDEVVQAIGADAKRAQVMTDSIFSFGELGFQEVETSKYVTNILEENGFTIERGVAGIPTAWTATWSNGSGGPVIALGSDIDGIPKASQKPGVAYHDPLVEGAPGHGEGHNSGQVVNVLAALAVQDLMERDNIPGTLMLWPGVAEELLGTKAYFVRAGMFDGIDAVIFTHVGDNLQTSWGQANGTGLVSVEYTFHGESAHSASKPWEGRSAADAVDLMNIGWNVRREHLRPEQRSHFVITNGGDQPNVVPSVASVWYFIREMDQAHIQENFDTLNRMADAAAMMTDTTVSREMIGTAYPRHFNKPMAEAAFENIQKVGLPEWSEDDQALAKAIQEEVGSEPEGLETELEELGAPLEKPTSGGSDDIGDVSWVVPTITIRYPSNFPGLPGHNWANAVSMATPVAHKGVVAGAKVVGMTTLDLLMNPKLMEESKAYFHDVQTKDEQYIPFLTAEDEPAIYKNEEIMAEFRSRQAEFYYDPSKYDTYLEQIGVTYPTLEPPAQ
jgi:aminobenzoyl-glutamate utilization protein B